MSRIKEVLNKKDNIISIYFTAGFPELNDTLKIIEQLDNAGVDMIEIGLPFSDPLADGPTIQESSMQAIKNGINTSILFEQLKNLRKLTEIPVIIMGYFNPILQYGVEKFCQECSKCGIDGLIIPDLPIDFFHNNYYDLFKNYNLHNMFLITPQTSDERIRYIDEISDGFIYMVSSFSITGEQNSFGDETINYFNRINNMNLKTPLLVGFGISNKETFNLACENSKGAIIGSAYINNLKINGISGTKSFIQNLTN